MSAYLESLMSAGETVQFRTRQHPIRLVRSLLLNGGVIALLVLLAGLGGGFGSAGGPFGAVLMSIALLLALVPLVRLLADLAQWYAREYVITTRRVMQLEGVLSKVVSDSNLDKVNDVVLRQSALGRVLGFGDIEIITGSDIGLDELDDIRHPVRFKREMLDNKEDFDTLSRLREDEAELTDAEIPDAIERLAELRDRGLISSDEFDAKKAELLARL